MLNIELKMYDTWDAGRVAKVSGIEVTGRVLGMPDLKCPAQNYLLGARNAHNAQTINHEKHCLKIVYSDIIEVADSESDHSLFNRKVSFSNICILPPAG